MNLIVRFFWMWLCACLARRREDVMGESRIDYRCLPHDIDVNLHLTNSRYHSFMDLGRINYLIRTGGWAKVRKAGYLPVLGSSSIRFRRPIKPFQKFTVTTRILSWDERWLYLEQRLVTPKEVASIMVCKTAFISKTGRVPTADLMRVLGHEDAPPPLTDTLRALNALDQTMAV